MSIIILAAVVIGLIVIALGALGVLAICSYLRQLVNIFQTWDASVEDSDHKSNLK